ncbi:ketosteroid isomerase-like protein [Winogradskyella wandonensis]|uniref:Ketosteroid isomerase-like protein n=1 Tax=Winogradskyella wandonensis TaxID=1442586 RepID=A0A4R1KVD8_9FLAO|nr:nuclear transport factor 2 family protein [Winogradskyella wandonensis]TCK69114.1 ketosteroid isomerase-like protein [Winogradskyella wandonensis]
MIDLIEKFYDAFQKLDSEAMTSCYHQEVVFKDPAFGVVKGKDAKNVWRMLCASQKGKDFKVKFYDINIYDDKVFATWEADYIFSKTGREVHNKISAEFEFKDGLIIRHTDRFNLHKWATQAFGFKGWLLGGTSFFKRKLQKQTNALLDKFEKKH